MEKLKALRLSKNLTQGDLAKQLGVSRTTITMWENGLSKPRFDTLVHLSQIFDCAVDEFLSIKKNNITCQKS